MSVGAFSFHQMRMPAVVFEWTSTPLEVSGKGAAGDCTRRIWSGCFVPKEAESRVELKSNGVRLIEFYNIAFQHVRRFGLLGSTTLPFNTFADSASLGPNPPTQFSPLRTRKP